MQNTIIAKLIPWNLLTEDILYNLPTEMKVHLTPVMALLRDFVESKKNPPIEWINDTLLLVEACLDRTWESLNSGHWKSVAVKYRYCYSLSCILKAVLLELEYSCSDEKSTLYKDLLKTIIEQIDKGILLGAPLPCILSLLPTIASELNKRMATLLDVIDIEDLVVDALNISDSTLSGFVVIDRYFRPSMQIFHKEMFGPKVPGLLQGCINHWRASRLWKHLNYLTRIAGSRTVPVEIGSRYTDEDWTQQLLTFSDFLQKYILAKRGRIGYLAQHNLFDQIPELRDDFTIPDYCNFTDSDDDVEEPDINAWFGPSKTISPLHFDPKNNLLCQVVGHKRVILYHPDDTSNLYPYDTRLLSNTAQVDPLKPDYKKWPDFANAKGYIAYLGPGDVLYIPPKWWHHVTSLTPSFSISFWWK